MAVISPIFFLATIFLHELAHAYTFFWGYRQFVNSIYLYALGGLTICAIDASGREKKSLALTVAIAGPAVNAVIGIIFLTAYYLAFGQILDLISFLLFFHGWAQIGLAAYNMLPG